MSISFRNAPLILYYISRKNVHSAPVGLRENVPYQKRNHFHFDLWFWLTLQNWVLDFGRPIAMVMRLCVMIDVMNAVW